MKGLLIMMLIFIFVFTPILMVIELGWIVTIITDFFDEIYRDNREGTIKLGKTEYTIRVKRIEDDK